MLGIFHGLLSLFHTSAICGPQGITDCPRWHSTQTSAVWLLRPHAGLAHTEGHLWLGSGLSGKRWDLKGMALGWGRAQNGLWTSCWSAGNLLLGSRERKELLPVYKSSMTLSILFSSAFLFFPSKSLWMKAAGRQFPQGHRFLVLLSLLSREHGPCYKMVRAPFILLGLPLSISR